MTFLWRLVILVIVGFAPAISATAEPLPRSVLILDQAYSGAPFPTALIAAFRSTLNAGAGASIAVYTEHLDFIRFHGPGYEKTLDAYMREKYHEHPIGVIVVTGPAALEFALRLRSNLGFDVPVVFALVDEAAASLVDLPPNVTGTTIRLTFRDAVIAAKALVPRLKRIALVGVPLERQTYRHHFKWEIPLFAGELEFIDLTGLSMTEVRKHVATLPEDAAIVYTPLFVDGIGTAYRATDALAMVAEVANRPIVIDQDNFFGYGGTGGFVASAGPIGQEAARLALRILNGESASSIPVVLGDLSKPVFDGRELQRWGISEAGLPPGSEVRFRPPSLWRQYRWQFIAVIAVLLTQAALISGLLFERRARKRAQDEIGRALAFERLLAEISTSLLGTLHRDINRAIQRALQIIAEFLGAERIALWRMGTDGRRFEPTHTWIASSMSAPQPLVAGERLPWIVARVARGDIVNLPNVDEMLPESVADKRALRQLGVQSLLMVPLALDDATMGAVSLDTVSAARVWPEALIPRLRLLSEIFGSLLVRQRAAERVGEARFETGQFRERLAHLVRVRTAGEMSVAIAHEISQPLVAIKNYALAARRRLPRGNALETAKVEKLMDKIGAQASRAGEVIHSLRAMVKMHQSEAAMVDIGQLVASALRLVEMEKRVVDIRLEVAAEPDLSPVFADAIQIQQVVLNLAHNAIEAMEAAAMTDGVLKVGVMGTTENEILVSVADSGPGIAPGDLEHIFDSFYSTKALGLGIGLSISRSIVEAHGGRLSLASNTSSGSVFQFTLPIANEGG
ncbi:GAF domain-containing protein [Rhizobiales bacterium GAS113]|nr:GAF domain-containing protein [Rhizobiales bacterium GAS113]